MTSCNKWLCMFRSSIVIEFWLKHHLSCKPLIPIFLNNLAVILGVNNKIIIKLKKHVTASLIVYPAYLAFTEQLSGNFLYFYILTRFSHVLVYRNLPSRSYMYFSWELLSVYHALTSCSFVIRSPGVQLVNQWGSHGCHAEPKSIYLMIRLRYFNYQ